MSLYIDGGGEYKGLDLYLNLKLIEHLASPSHTPQRVAIEEHRHRHIVETAKTYYTRHPSLQVFGCLLVNMQLILLIDCPPNFYTIHLHMKKYLVLHPDTIHLELLVIYVIYGLSLTPTISLSLGPLHVSI